MPRRARGADSIRTARPTRPGRAGLWPRARRAGPEVRDRIARGESVGRSEYYLRIAPFFETASPAHAWLNRIVAVGLGERRPNGVTYDVFEIL